MLQWWSPFNSLTCCLIALDIYHQIQCTPKFTERDVWHKEKHSTDVHIYGRDISWLWCVHGPFPSTLSSFTSFGHSNPRWHRTCVLVASERRNSEGWAPRRSDPTFAPDVQTIILISITLDGWLVGCYWLHADHDVLTEKRGKRTVVEMLVRNG